MFENRTVYDMPAIRAMILVTARKIQRRRCLLRQGFLLIAGGLALACGLLLASVFGRLDFSSRLICVAALIIGGVAVLEGLCFRWFMARNTRKGLLRMGGALERHFLFDEESFQSLQEGAESTYDYGTIQAAYETEGYFFFLLNTGHSAVLDQKGFLKGTAGDFRDFLEKKLGRPLEFVK